MSSVCFISDLHLDPSRPAVTRAFESFLIQHSYCTQLYILGDLFEAWPGDDDDAPLSVEVCRMLRQCSESGTELFVMPGNRDFLLSQAFCASTGASALADPTVIDLFGEPTLLMHGDSLCTADTDYQAFRLKARDPRWQAELMAKPLEERRDLARELRAMSKEAASLKSQDIMDVTEAEVHRVMQQHGVRRLIHGHTHRPGVHDYVGGKRWVLGAWEEQAWYLEVKPDSMNLELININQ